MFLTKLLLRWVARKAAYQVVMGRLIDRNRPEKSRFLRHEIDTILALAWHKVDDILPDAHLERLPTLGNRQNTYLAVLTVAAYHAFLEVGVERDYAIELFADLGWKVYTQLVALPRLIARLVTRDPQKQMNLILGLLMCYPFSSPGRPGYEVKAWAEPDRFCTHWYHCPPNAYVQQYVEQHGDQGEVEAFHRSWCWYDWALAMALVEGGDYERPHTLSLGDEVCDMSWYARAHQERQ